MNPDVMDCYIQAGRIASNVRDETAKTVEDGASLLETAEYAEELTRQMGGEVAFPCNISINEIASHYTPLRGKRRFAYGDLVKLDVGVHIDGYIADTARTIEIGTDLNHMLIRAAERALDAAISEIREDVDTKHLGKVMEKTIRANGCRPVKDLTGHSVDRFQIHSGINIPNYMNAPYSSTLHAGDVVAVEPFTTRGRGYIRQGEVRIMSLLNNKAPGPKYSEMLSRFNTLPFTPRWVRDAGELDKMRLFTRKYPVLVERDGCPVAQAEHTVIVQDDGCRLLTA